ncbi:hypothetical protein [Microbacterium aurum]
MTRGRGIRRQRLAPPALAVISRRRSRRPAEEGDARAGGAQRVGGRLRRPRRAVDVDPVVRGGAEIVRAPGAAERHERHPVVAGMLAAAEAFDYRVPELHAGHAATDLPRPAPYPAACRPQAWSAAAAVTAWDILRA